MYQLRSIYNVKLLIDILDYVLKILEYKVLIDLHMGIIVLCLLTQ